jgi:hypothetical protein
MILILEDDDARLRRFARTIATITPGMALRVWRDAHTMTSEVDTLLPAARLVSLDHDLLPLRGGADPGDGLDAARHLATRQPVAPVIVHTSNGFRGEVMMETLRLAGWTCIRVAPFGDDWIENDWAGVVASVLRSR